ncbi:MAG TPA: hydrolase [Longimicrobium sp.]|nr:hydrolase [Longimicrobium sp.]
MADEPFRLDPATTALVLIDLQKGIVWRETAPHTSAAVVANAVKLADAFRAAGGLVVLVRVAFSADMRDVLNPPRDEVPPPQKPSPDWSDIVPELGPKAGDVIITKHQWGAFYGTELDLQLRRRGIKTIVLGGIATNYGVESTARDAWERNYALVIAEDATTTFTEEAHMLALRYVFPRISRVRRTALILAALRGAK